MSDFLICGGGVSGMLVARGLAAAGASVQLVERGVCGREASWAGGGIVSPLYPWRYSEAVTALANKAQDAYPLLAQMLLAETGIDVELSACGLLMLEAEDQQAALDWAARHGRRMQAWQEAEIYTHETRLSAGYQRALYMPDIANIRNPRLVKALAASLRLQTRVDILEQSEVLCFDHRGNKMAAVRVRQGNKETRLQADNFVFAAGAWTGELLGQLGVNLPVVPVKGQMLLYQADRPLLNGIVLSQGRYVIPRQDHHILVGSTLEHVGYDKTSTDTAANSLRLSAEAMLPALADIRIKQQWAGLRPGAPDGIPYIGYLPGFDNVAVNAGHYRNGLVLAPASAELLVSLMTGQSVNMNPDPYAPALRLD